MKSIISAIITLLLFISCSKENILIVTSSDASERIEYGAQQLANMLEKKDYKISFTHDMHPDEKTATLIIGERNDSLFQIRKGEFQLVPDHTLAKEGFIIGGNRKLMVIEGSDASGTLYGCLELAGIVKKSGNIPRELLTTGHPEMVMRGACVGLQKTEYLPGRKVYEYPYTPENFPWFYDKDLWIKYLDILVENRMNSLYLWNGHPFASLVKLEDYPYALEVDEETFRKNEEIFSFLTEEADKRGIWVIQMFYNIIVSKPFAEHHNIETQERNRPITPLISDYTRKSIAAFIEKYPNVGLMVCLGEAMNTIEDDVEWFTRTIIPGVKDGLVASGQTEEPPIILRGHDTNPVKIMEAALPIYKNLYTTHKYNGESLTTYEPRGSWAETHQNLSKLGSVHISNVHILANLEPFRYGSPDFIQKAVIAMHDIQGANGLHLYPQSSYWDWPYTADNTNPRLLQIDRDWMWYKAWGRYAWNSRRKRNDEIQYWTDQLSDFYGCEQNADQILKAYEEAGEIAPKLLRRFGISDGNRQTLLLGMFMSQLVNPYKWRVYSSFYSSNGPEGEILLEYAEKEWKKQPHKGETPPQIIEQVLNHGKKAVQAIDSAEPYVLKNKEEFKRLKNDIYCYNAFAQHFTEKVKAAMLVLRYKYSNNISDLEKALPHLEKSVEHFQILTDLTKDTYLYANSMQTQQRRIPIDGTNGNYKTWPELLPEYKEELNKFKNNVERLKTVGTEELVKDNPVLVPAKVKFLTPDIKTYQLSIKEKVYSDKDYVINDMASELRKLQGLKLSFEEQQNNGTSFEFSNTKPVKVVVGYFNGHSYKILQPPALETNATANDQGQADIRIANAIEIPGLYPVNIYTYYYGPGTHKFELNKGIALILGFMDGNQKIETYDAGIGVNQDNASVDWLFY